MNKNDDYVLCSLEQQPIPCFIEMVSYHPDAVNLIASGVAIAIICWGLGKGISEVVDKWKR